MYLCLVCSAEIDPKNPVLEDKTHSFHGCCPECGNKSLPVDTDTRVSISITWQELRILSMWAERWASQCDEKGPDNQLLKIVYGITDRIQAQHLDQRTGLTFRSELASISEAGYSYEQNIIKEDKQCQRTIALKKQKNY